jgi:hypothetical protein
MSMTQSDSDLFLRLERLKGSCEVRMTPVDGEGAGEPKRWRVSVERRDREPPERIVCDSATALQALRACLDNAEARGWSG